MRPGRPAALTDGRMAEGWGADFSNTVNDVSTNSNCCCSGSFRRIL